MAGNLHIHGQQFSWVKVCPACTDERIAELESRLAEVERERDEARAELGRIERSVEHSRARWLEDATAAESREKALEAENVALRRDLTEDAITIIKASPATKQLTGYEIATLEKQVRAALSASPERPK